MGLNKSWIVVAVDGQAASGKGTISRILSQKLNLNYLDTGKLYRALTYYLISNKRKRLLARDKDAFIFFLKERRPSDDELQSEFISRHTPDVASQQWARRMLLDVQRDFANTPVDGYEGAILDGRDIGTVVCPSADVKFFIIANIGIRAQRRFDQLRNSGQEVSIEKVLADLEIRDKRDRERDAAPMVAADDAVVLDTSAMSIEEAVAKAVQVIDARLSAD